jgi:putative adenylate-forming enzyme
VVEKEWLDAERTRYHPIVTDFRRTTQPILRFRLDDVILASEADGPRCPCGSVFETLEKIEGRQDDVLYLPKLGSGEPLAVFPDFVRRALILALPTGCDYTVAQTALSAWTVETSEPSANSRVVEEVALLCAGLGVHAPALSFAPWTAPHPGAKRRRVRRMMPPPRDQ